MKKYTNFLQTESYRRTFIIYLLIALVFMGSILGFVHRDIYKTAQERFLAEASQVCEDVDSRAEDVVRSIDRFTAQIYSSPSLAEDFFRFFGSTAEEYISRRLALPTEPEVSILANFKNLVLSSNNSIRHVICYAREHIVDLEFNDQGDSRHRIITTSEADEICRSGCVYQKDIHRNSNYYGKMSVVLDLTRFIRDPLAGAEGRGISLILPDQMIPAGTVRMPPEQVMQVMEQGGFPKRLTGASGKLYVTAYTSQCLPYTMLYLTAPEELLTGLFWKFLSLAVGCVVAFGAIAVVLVRLFSRDTAYISAILTSMEQAEQENFTPVTVHGNSREYDAIVRGLNELYAHLESLIQREYKLTISQQRAQMEMLTAQLSPHFLYNTLERIRMRAVLNQDSDVAQATAGLGLLYRNIVKTKPVIDLRQEVKITEQYLDLMTFLYGDQFLYYFDIDDSLLELQTPKIWMQPIIENFFKHNFRQDDRIKVVVVELKAVGSGFEGRFFDNIGHLSDQELAQINAQLQNPGEKDHGIGLSSVLYRLQLFYGGSLTLSMENNEPAGICIHIRQKGGNLQHVSTSDRG